MQCLSRGLEQWYAPFKDYVMAYLDFLTEQPVKRILLPDTLGVLIPSETYEYLHEIVNRYPHTHFDFHAHNDYDLGKPMYRKQLRLGCMGCISL